ncbi:MAG: sporulation initiation factor Spo0A C-terminal domain-containing protein [Christensenellales bacterium]|jgi:DNA-binding NarL/FixJ family response regulator
MRIRVLIVDDNVLSESIEDALHRDGAFEVAAIAENKGQALSFLRNTEIDLMLLNVTASPREGKALLREILENELQMPVTVVMSSADDETVIESFLEMGVVFYFVKPFDADATVRRLHDLFREEIPKKADETDARLAREIRRLLEKAAVPPQNMGRRFLETAIALAVEDPDCTGRMMTDLYPKVAVAFGSTRQRVERAIRHTIAVAISRAGTEDIKELFGSTEKEKLNNSTFIALLAERAGCAVKE